MMITVIKQNPEGQEIWRYSGSLLKRSKNYLLLEAFFDRDDMDIHGMRLSKGDRFLETYYFSRWYNIFKIHDNLSNRHKGWYCNISSPAIEKNGMLSYRDYALDLLVFPDGRQVVLDEDEFAALEISPMEINKSLAALVELQNHFKLLTA